MAGMMGQPSFTMKAGYAHSADGDHGDLPQNVNNVGGSQELAVGKGHDHTDEDQQRPGPHLVQDQGK